MITGTKEVGSLRGQNEFLLRQEGEGFISPSAIVGLARRDAATSTCG